jgi:hypothetical protein
VRDIAPRRREDDDDDDDGGLVPYATEDASARAADMDNDDGACANWLSGARRRRT